MNVSYQHANPDAGNESFLLLRVFEEIDAEHGQIVGQRFETAARALSKDRGNYRD